MVLSITRLDTLAPAFYYYFRLMVRVALDFDGVLCDSVHEAFFSTWIAYTRYHKGSSPTHIPLVYRDTFYSYRPFIRTGQHLMLLHHVIEKGSTLRSQDDFERELEAVSDHQLHQWRVWLYKVREEMRAEDYEHYLRLQPLYAPMRAILPRLSGVEGVIILSTKRADFITDILEYNDIQWDPAAVYSVNKESKIAALRRMRGGVGGDEPVIFIDDHRPHLLPRTESAAQGLRCLVATWGYVAHEWCVDQTYETINIEDVDSLLSPFFCH